MKLITTERRFKALQCSELNCKKSRVILVRLAEGDAGLCGKHWKVWLAERRGTTEARKTEP